MRIVLVIDYFGKTTNGTTMTTRHLVKGLIELGHDVRVLTGVGNGWDNVYETGEVSFPIVNYFCRKNGFPFAKVKRKIIEEAIEGADLVHFLDGFHFCRVIKKICDKKGIKTCSAFHIQPEDATAQLCLGDSKLINGLIYRIYRNSFFNKFSDIHCPSNMMAEQLKKYKYKSNLHVISNGISDFFHPIEGVERPKEYKDKYLITMVGRISREKRQDLLIKAIAKSKYVDKIQLLLLGQGTWLKRITRMAKRKLKINPAKIMFVNQEELVKILNYSDLYVHTSDIESEAISCMEAFACGKVPIISDSKLSATSQFALTKNNVFKARDYLDLANKIDYWIEHEEEKKELEKKYIEYAKQYTYAKCVKELEKIFVNIVNNGK